MASARGAEAEGARPAHGLPRDHPGGDPACARRDARGRQAARGRTGDPARPRPPLRLRGLARPLEEGHAGPVRRPRAVGRPSARGRARARAPGVRLGVVLGSRRCVRPRLVRGAARRRRRQTCGPGPRLRTGRNAPDRGHGRARRAGGARPRRRARRCDLHRSLGRREAVHAPPGGAVHDLDAAAGGEPQAPLLGADDDAGRPAPLRQRLHHLHAHRLDDAVGVGADRRPTAGRRALRPRLDPGAAEAVHPQGQERAGGARGDPAGRRLLPDAEVRGARARPRRARPLRADLEADARLADGRCARADGLAAVRHGDSRQAATSSSAPPER